MKVGKLIFATFLFLASALTSAAQSGGVQCSLKPARAPELRGLRLGMTVSQVKARYPRLPIGTASELGELRVTKSKTDLEEIDREAFAGVDSIFLYFIDERLASFQVVYSPLPWKNVSQFTERMSEALKLPDGWSGSESQQTLNCDGFQVQTGWMSYAGDSMSAYIDFKELGVSNIIKERIDKRKEQRLQSFKP